MSLNSSIQMKQRRANLLLHASVLFLAIVIDLPSSIPEKINSYQMVGYLVSRIFLLTVFYSCYFWLVPVYLSRKKTWAFILALLILVNAVTLVGYFTLQFIHSGMYGEPFHFFYNLKMHMSGTIAMIFASVFGIAFRTVTGWYEEIRKRSTLEQEKLRSELMLLKAQVNPHFLFNTLNAIDFLITSEPPKASQSLIRLSSLLRYVIYDTVKDLVPLKQEIEQMESYIDLHRLRYGNEATIRYKKSGDPAEKMIAPMLFIPFIENAFKHSDQEGIRKGLDIQFNILTDSIEFTCQNYLPLRKDNLQPGIGLENVNKRLDMQYAGMYLLSAGKDADMYKVSLILKQA